MIKPHRKIGFTLLELLLVVAILGIIFTLAISYYQQQANVTKINRTVLQIQQYLQAATTYYLKNNNNWPNPSPDPNFAAYIPLGMNNNPWGGTYSYLPIAGGKVFRVVLTNIPINSSIQIANKLPSAQALNCTLKTCMVQAEEAIPFQPSQPGGFLVKSVGETYFLNNLQTGTIPSFTCPVGWQGHVEPMLSGLWANDPSGFQKFCLIGMTKVLISQLNTVSQCTQNDKTFSCSFQLNALTRPDKAEIGNPKACSNYIDPIAYGQIKLAYIAYCCIPDTNNNANCAAPN